MGLRGQSLKLPVFFSFFILCIRISHFAILGEWNLFLASSNADSQESNCGAFPYVRHNVFNVRSALGVNQTALGVKQKTPLRGSTCINTRAPCPITHLPGDMHRMLGVSMDCTVVIINNSVSSHNSCFTKPNCTHLYILQPMLHLGPVNISSFGEGSWQFSCRITTNS